MPPRRGRGFTLVEIVLIIVILGILAAIAVPRLGSSDIEAATDALIADLRQARTQARSCYTGGDPMTYGFGDSRDEWGVYEPDCGGSIGGSSFRYFDDDFTVDGPDELEFEYPDGALANGDHESLEVGEAGNGQSRTICVREAGAIRRGECE